MTITSFGKFYRQPPMVDQETGHSFYPHKNAKGEDFHMDVAPTLAEYNGSTFISAKHPFYAAVREDGTIRVVSNEPSRVQPDGDEWFIASDEEIAPGMVYNPRTNTVSEAPYNPSSDGPSDLAQLRIYALRKDQLVALEEALKNSRAANADELRVYWQYATSLPHNHPLLEYAAKFFGFKKAEFNDFYKELRATV